MGKLAELEKIKREILDNNICPELSEQATQLVFGSGNINANVVFIGEAPGKQEDLQGKPFVGASGKFLDEMLASISLERKDIYITNIVKYRPLNNRDPLKSERDAFWPYLMRQLDVIKPNVVVTLGRHSMSQFLPRLSIGNIHGQPQPCVLGQNELVILPLYHPAYALYNGKLRQVLKDDFMKIAEII